jgi:cellulose synthase (UDP-forming)
MPELNMIAPLLLVVGVLGVCSTLFDPQSKYPRAFAAIICIALTIRYLYWRILFAMPADQSAAAMLWSRAFLLGEGFTLLSSMLVFFFMSRTINRSADADAHAGSPLMQAPVDVFIATYNEDRSILERTIVGAKAIHHSDLRVWVLDDGAREWVKDLASELGVEYAFRVKGKHAKAGNVNHGLKCALETGRKPEFLLLLDADFVPSRTILRRTLGLFDDPHVGIVQTPQHFFNFDPVQSGLECTAIWPDEQRFFFDSLMPCKDAWGAAFCCGTSAVFRIAALEASDGMAIETVTEDMLTTFKLEEFGYRTIYLNERLSMGLAPESLNEYVSQRSRWCLGGIQQLYTRWSFLGRGKHSWINRLAYFDSVLYWISVSAFKLALLAAPIIFWFTGAAVIRATGADLLYYLAPMVAANLLFMSAVSENRVLPIMTDISQMLMAFFVVRTVISGLVRPFGRGFKVTAKGLSSDRSTVQWRIIWPILLLGFLTLTGVLSNLAQFNAHRAGAGYVLNVFWSLFNIFMLTAAAVICIEPPKRRREERFQSEESAVLLLANGTTCPCLVKNISVGGASLLLSGSTSTLCAPSAVSLDDGRLILPVQIVRAYENVLAISFICEDAQRHRLIEKLFTGRYNNNIPRIDVVQIFRQLLAVVHT